MKNSSAICNLCDTVVGIIQNELNLGKRTVAILEAVVEFICTVLHAEKQCGDFIYNLNNIINWLTHGWSTGQICKELHMCNQTLSHDLYKHETTNHNHAGLSGGKYLMSACSHLVIKTNVND